MNIRKIIINPYHPYIAAYLALIFLLSSESPVLSADGIARVSANIIPAVGISESSDVAFVSEGPNLAINEEIEVSSDAARNCDANQSCYTVVTA